MHADKYEQERRLEVWCREIPRVLGPWRDAEDRPFYHTYFFPAEQYEQDIVERLADHCAICRTRKSGETTSPSALLPILISRQENPHGDEAGDRCSHALANRVGTERGADGALRQIFDGGGERAGATALPMPPCTDTRPSVSSSSTMSIISRLWEPSERTTLTSI